MGHSYPPPPPLHLGGLIPLAFSFLAYTIFMIFHLVSNCLFCRICDFTIFPISWSSGVLSHYVINYVFVNFQTQILMIQMADKVYNIYKKTVSKIKDISLRYWKYKNGQCFLLSAGQTFHATFVQHCCIKMVH